MNETYFTGALYQAASLALRPDDVGGVADWTKKHRRIAQGTSPQAGRWDHAWSPYLPEIMDCCAPDHPCSHVTVMKSAQTGVSEAVINWLGFIVDRVPGPTMVVHPTSGAAETWVTEKLNPNIEVTPALSRKILDQVSRSGKGSTMMQKRFAGGFIKVTGANSAPGLRQSTIRFAALDDWDDFPDDLDGQGDPQIMIDARQKTFRDVLGLSKQLRISTPTDKITSRVYRAWLETDQRHFHVPCPHCKTMQVLDFENMHWPGKDDEETSDECRPDDAVFSCRSCGCDIEEKDKTDMLGAGKWVPAHPGPGRQPGFHIWAAYSRFESWAGIAREFEKAKGSIAALKAFFNLTLGLPSDSKGTAPKWEELLARRDGHELGQVPAWAAYLTCAIDVQGDGLYYSVRGWGDRRRSAMVDKGFIAGTTTEEGTAWPELKELLARPLKHALGGDLFIRLAGIDSGFNSNAVYEFCRRNKGVLALKGRSGHGVPAIVQGSRGDVIRRGRKAGQKKKRGLTIWLVGTWDLKSTFYEKLARKVVADDPNDPTVPEFFGYPKDADEEYFQQITAESRIEKKRAGRTVIEWVAEGANHYLDCEIYNEALHDQARLGLLQPHDWARLLEDCKPRPEAQADMFEAAAPVVVDPPAPPPAAPEPKARQEHNNNQTTDDPWVSDTETEGWVR